MAEILSFVLTHHAEQMVAERNLKAEWIEEVLKNPDALVQDGDDRDLYHAYKSIPERDGRVLHVVYNMESEPWRVITGFFDRAWKGKL
jgi:hypothetical protein